MSKLIKFSIKEKKITILAVIFILCFGFYSYYYMPRQENPDMESPGVQIITIFPGASAETVEKQVTSKIEDKIAELDGVDFIKSFSQDNVSIAFALLKPEVEDYEKEWQKLRTALDDLQKQLPDKVLKPEINTNLTETAGIIVSLSSKDYDSNRLADFAEDYKTRLSKLDGIRKVEINGNRENRIEIKIKQEKIDAVPLSIEEISRLIQAQNVIIPAGSIKTKEGKINVKIPDSFNRLSDFKNLIVYVSKENGSMLRLKDIADVSIKEVDSDKYFIKDGKNSILISAFFEENKNVVLIGNEVRKEIDNLRPLYPDSLDIDEVLFLPEDVKKSVDSFIINLIEGIAFVILVIFIGMGLRNALVVSLVIPLSIAATFIYMFKFNVHLHQVSIAALIIALGMLVDNAIVISDAVQENINQGMNKHKAAFLGAKEQATPIFTSTLTTIAAFSPLASLPGSGGEFVASLPIIVITSLSASFLVAMLVTPCLTSFTLKERTEKRDYIKPIQNFYTKLMEFNLRKYVLSTLVLITIVTASLFVAFRFVEVKMFPYIDKDWVYVNINNEIVGDIESTENLVLKADKILKSYPEITDTVNSVGGGLPRYYMMADIMMPSENNGMILAKFDLKKTHNFKAREDFVYELQKKFDNEFIGGYGTCKLLEINIPGPNIEVKITGEDKKALDAIAKPLYQWMLERKETMNVQKIKPKEKYLYKVNIDDEKAIRMGLNKYDIQNQINMSLNGSVAGTLTTEKHNFDIFVSSNIESVSGLENLKIKSKITDKKVNLKNFASISLEKSLDSIYRYNRQPMYQVSADIRPGHGNIQGDIERFLSEQDLSNVEINYGGDKETMDLYLSGLVGAAIIALVIIYVILLLQFRSMTQPFIILITIPLAMIGVIFALLITNTNFTFTVGLGAASLMGIVVNNGILLIEYINRAVNDGMEVIDACKTSVRRRVRPILLSSITTIFGLIPLALGTSPFFKPMAIALMGGLISATFMTVTVIPMIYYLTSKRR